MRSQSCKHNRLNSVHQPSRQAGRRCTVDTMDGWKQHNGNYKQLQACHVLTLVSCIVSNSKMAPKMMLSGVSASSKPDSRIALVRLGDESRYAKRMNHNIRLAAGKDMAVRSVMRLIMVTETRNTSGARHRITSDAAPHGPLTGSGASGTASVGGGGVGVGNDIAAVR